MRATHERWDGGGYPDGLRCEDIPFGARIIAVCDAFDAMTTTRPYRLAMRETVSVDIETATAFPAPERSAAAQSV